MEYYVGLDVSLKQTSICVVNQTGSVVREGIVESDPETLAAFVRSNAPGAVRIGLETGPTSTWLWTELKRLGLPVICIDAPSQRKKRDRLPGWVIAERPFASASSWCCPAAESLTGISIAEQTIGAPAQCLPCSDPAEEAC